ncbi:MAG: restriction endonuclease subunit S [Thiobacillus sp.]|nr:restriction endonuclease subunit S [Thiobacillus sp.]
MNWPQVQLSPALAKVVRGVTFSQADASSAPFDGAVPVLRAGNIQRRLIIDQDLSWVSRSFVSTDQYLQRNDIVVCTSSGSASLVGKSAILDTEFDGTWGAFNAVIRCNPDVLLPEFIAFWLSSDAFRAWKDRQVQGANIQNIRQSSIENIRFPLPTLPEQQRVVDVLRQAEAVAKAKQSISDKIDLLVKTAYWEHFGDWFNADGLRDPVRISDHVTNSQYGVSEAMEETGAQAVLRMNSITTSGWLNLTDLKYASLSKKDVEATTLINGDLLFNRTNSKELVGKCAIWRDANRPFSFASYLVRLRLKPDMLPEYLWATLNSAYGKYRLMNSAKQAVSMANVSPTDLGRITVPLPPLALQEKFARLINVIEALRVEMLSKLTTFDELQTLVTQQALLGEITEAWRDQHSAEIAAAAATRDALLRERGAKLASRPVEPVLLMPVAKDSQRPARQWLLAELSEFQRQLLAAFCAYPEQPLLVEDADVFARFCDDENVLELLKYFGPSLNNRIRRTLSQLSSLGLIAKVTLPKQDPQTGERDYLKAFRPLRKDEYSKMADLETLQRALSSGEAEVRHYFTVVVDYETSEHAGAGGMFQVAALCDEGDKDRTDLVDQDKHYAALDELANDIARRLGVRADQIELEE